MKLRFCLLLSLVSAAAAQEFVPSLLSRAATPHFQSRQSSFFLPYIGALAGYDSGPLIRDFTRGAGPFEELDGGLEALYSGRRTSVQLDYRFAARHYPRDSRLDRSNHELSLDARVRLARRWSLRLRDAGSSYSFDRDLYQAPSGPPAALLIDGGPEVFHSRTLANTALVDLTYAPTHRTSLTVAGDGFLVERQFRGLADVAGWRARADLARRFTRRQTIALAYSFTRFQHRRIFGGADYAVYSLGYSVRLGRYAELNLLGGAGRLRSAAIRPVVLDPEIARLLGMPQGAEVFRIDTWTPHLLAAWTQRLGRLQWRAEYARLVTDGGGLSGLARRNRAALSVSGTMSRSWRLSLHLAGYQQRSLDTLLYNGRMGYGGVSLARRLGSRAEAVWRYYYSLHDFGAGRLRHFDRHQASAGLLFYLRPLDGSASRGSAVLTGQ
jgi:hypothetical protein